MNLSLLTCYTQIKDKDNSWQEKGTGLSSQLTPNPYKDVNINTDKELVINASYTKIWIVIIN